MKILDVNDAEQNNYITRSVQDCATCTNFVAGVLNVICYTNIS